MNKVFGKNCRSQYYGTRAGYHTYETAGSEIQIRHGDDMINVMGAMATSGGQYATRQSAAQAKKLARKIVRLLNLADAGLLLRLEP